MRLLKFSTFITLCFLSLLSISAYGQIESVDVLVGPGLTALGGNPVVKANFDPRISLSGGVGINYRLSGKWLVSAKLLYEDKGGKQKGPYYYDDGNGHVICGEMKIRQHLKYLTLPVTAGYEFGHKAKFRVEAGPYVGFLLKYILTGDLNGQPLPMEDDTDLLKRADLGLSIGVRELIPLNDHMAFQIGAYDNLGLFNISARPVVDDKSDTTNFLGLSIGLCFRLK